MEIGSPKRIYTIEPIESPIPPRPTKRDEPPVKRPSEPAERPGTRV
jgi:hypothetical protein